MKKVTSLLVCIFVIVVAYVFNVTMRGEQHMTPETRSVHNIGIVVTTAKLYAINMKESTGKGSFPQGDSSKISSELISFGLCLLPGDLNVTNKNEEIIDGYGNTLCFMSSTQEISIISTGADGNLKTSDDIIRVISLPRAAK